MCRLLVAIEFVIVMVIKAGREFRRSSVVECVLILSVGPRTCSVDTGVNVSLVGCNRICDRNGN